MCKISYGDDADIMDVPDKHRKVELGSFFADYRRPVPDKNEVNFDIKAYFFISR